MNVQPSHDRNLATTLEDKYSLKHGWTFMSGTHALVRLPIQQKWRDLDIGLNTAGFVSGYRGSPLGRYDLELWRAAETLKDHHIHFQPGVNEDLAATAVWGSQYVGELPRSRYDGIFAIWYGKTPGVDRSGDVLRHANSAGTGQQGGVLALCGDDHGAKSSTQAAQSDYILMATGIPVIYPANVQEILDFGLHGLAISRHSGCWVGMKLVTDVVESSSSVYVAPDHPPITQPKSSDLSPDGVHIRLADTPIAQESRLFNHKLHAVLDYVRLNSINRIVIDSAKPRLGIVAAGKSYMDTRQALLRLGLDEEKAAIAGIRLLKIGMVWPLEPQIIRTLVQDLDQVFVVEEKRPLLENQIKTILFDAQLGHTVSIVGKYASANEWSSDRGAPMLSSVGELSPPLIAAQIAQLLRLNCSLLPPGASTPEDTPGPMRTPNFCSGCPHNISTRVPKGSRALAGIGCHAIAMMRRPETTGTISHMGGEGVMWVGQAPFTDEKHVFANLGDGTYFHSGLLAIRQAVAAKVPITYKILVNGFVSMTGGQPIDGELSVPKLVDTLLAEGVGKLVVVTDDTEKYRNITLADGVQVHDRTELETVQQALREYPTVSALIYDQACATEKRRLRKRGKYPDPLKRTFINTEVCEGCGDCGEQSNCMSIEPVETELGRKRRINQFSCNKDFSCMAGFCPSFVTVHGGRVNHDTTKLLADTEFVELPEPTILELNGDESFAALVTGIGGTGVVTIGAIVAMAAHLDGNASSGLDVTGLAQKYGAVTSHIRIAKSASRLHSPRLATGEANLVVGCDLIVTASDEALLCMAAGPTRVVVDSKVSPTAEFTKNPDWNLDQTQLLERISGTVGIAAVASIPAASIATQIMGDTIAANMFMLGYAWQRGWVPISRKAIERAIELNGIAVDFNLKSFLWGRRLAHDASAVERLLKPRNIVEFLPSKLNKLTDIVEDRAQRLSTYQNAALAHRYRKFVARVTELEAKHEAKNTLSRMAARYYYKLLAAKDEFEVARLYASNTFREQLQQQFKGDYTLRFHLAAGPLVKRDPVTGAPRKRELGGWVMPVFTILAKLRFLRPTIFNPFRYTAERKLDAQLLKDYEHDMERLVAELHSKPSLDAVTLEQAAQFAAWPEQIRGYGHVRAATAHKVQIMRHAYWKRWERPIAQRQDAA